MAQSWVPTTATFTNVWVTVSTSDKGNVTGFNLNATYIWSQPGCPTPDASDWRDSACPVYYGNKLKLGSNNVHRVGRSARGWLLYEKMEAAKKSGMPWPLFMNPDNPRQAVIDRSMPVSNVTLDFFGGSLLAAAGFLIGMFVFFGITDISLRSFLRRRFPQKPWMHNEGWITGQIYSASARKKLYFLLAGIPFLIIPAPALVHDLLHANTPGSRLGLISCLPLIGIGCIIIGVILHRRWKRFSSAWLELRQNPLKTGDTLQGWIHLPSTLSNTPIMVILTFDCEEKWADTRWPSKYKTTYKQKHHEAVRVLKIDSMAGQGFAIEFNIPASSPGTLILGMRSFKYEHQITWTLKAYATIEGPNLDLSFKLPIFDGAWFAPACSRTAMKYPG